MIHFPELLQLIMILTVTMMAIKEPGFMIALVVGHPSNYKICVICVLLYTRIKIIRNTL